MGTRKDWLFTGNQITLDWCIVIFFVLFFKLDPVHVERNKKYATRTVSSTWTVKFKIYPYGYQHKWSSVLHATTGGNRGVYGYRVPAIFFRPGSHRPYICNAFSGNADYCYSYPKVTAYRKTSIIVLQRYIGSQVFYMIFIDGRQVLQKVNTKPLHAPHVNYYVGDPWYEPAFAKLYELSIETPQ